MGNSMLMGESIEKNQMHLLLPETGKVVPIAFRVIPMALSFLFQTSCSELVMEIPVSIHVSKLKSSTYLWLQDTAPFQKKGGTGISAMPLGIIVLTIMDTKHLMHQSLEMHQKHLLMMVDSGFYKTH